MSDTFEKMMAKFNQPIETTELAINLQKILFELKKSLLNLENICKSPTQYLESLNEISNVVTESSSMYNQYKLLQTTLQADVKSFSMLAEVAVSRNKAITEMIEFGSDDEDEAIAISTLAMVCLKINLSQTHTCLKVNSSTLRLLRIILASV